MQGLVAAVRTQAFCLSATEALGAKMSSSGLSRSGGWAWSLNQGAGGREEGRSLGVDSLRHQQSELSCCKEKVVVSRGPLAVMTEHSLCPSLASSSTIKGPLLSPWTCGLRVGQ